MLWQVGSRSHLWLPGTVPQGQFIPCEQFLLALKASPAPREGLEPWPERLRGAGWALGSRGCSLQAQPPQTAAPFLFCGSACIVFLGTTNP